MTVEPSHHAASKKNSIILYALLLVIIVAIVAAYSFSISSHVTSPSGNVTTTANASYGAPTITPGALPSQSCPMRTYSENSSITNTTGIQAADVSNTTDYVINAGTSGSVTYEVHVGASLEKATFGNATVDNWVQFLHAANSTSDTSAHSGINVTSTPSSEAFSYNANYTVTDTFHIAADAPTGTYWTILSPGECYGGPEFLLTVGSAPYTGPVTRAPVAG